MGNRRLTSTKYFLLAAAVTVMMPFAARAQGGFVEYEDLPMPEVEVDGSVLQSLGTAQKTANSPAVAPALRPPSSAPSAPMLTGPALTDSSVAGKGSGGARTKGPLLTEAGPEPVRTAGETPVSSGYKAASPPVVLTEAVELPLKDKTVRQPLFQSSTPLGAKGQAPEIAPVVRDVPVVAKAPAVPAQKPVALQAAPKSAPVILGGDPAAEPPKPKPVAAVAPVIREVPAPEVRPEPIPAAVAKFDAPIPGRKPERQDVAEVPAEKPVALAAAAAEPEIADAPIAPVVHPPLPMNVVPVEPQEPAPAVITQAAPLAVPAPVPVPAETRKASILKDKIFAALDRPLVKTPAPGTVIGKDVEHEPLPVAAAPAPKTETVEEPFETAVLSMRTSTKHSNSLNPAEGVPPAAIPAPVEMAAVADLTPVTSANPQKADNWRQDNPEVLIEEIPGPGRRPEIQTASEEFVQQARRTVLETYTVMRRDGADMPAMPKAKVAGEPLAAPQRLSVADLASDPLAQQIVDMTPEEVAQAISSIAPASGRYLGRELNAVSKPRIVRQEGERIYRSRNRAAKAAENSAAQPPPPQEPAPMQQASVTPKDIIASVQKDLHSPAAAPAPSAYALTFPAGEADLPAEAKSTIDSGVVGALKSQPQARIQIIAWASAPDGKEGSARRTSLSRALAVRSYLIGQGIDATRMDVRAMGVQTDPKAAPDKVDLILAPVT
ncbi:MAG: OmpA family protein [Micavibrio aeruginosavorus]|nr:OmpA family protein [Micavibrio aeruginosavorus]